MEEMIGNGVEVNGRDESIGDRDDREYWRL